MRNTALKQSIKKHRALGTNITLQIFGNDDASQILDETTNLIDHYEDLLTVNRDHSQVMDINHAAGSHAVVVSSPVYSLIKLAVEKSRENFGFNALIGPVVKLWKIGFEGARVPNESEIKEKMQLIDPFSVKLDDLNQSVFLTQKGMELDLGGIAKGWIADRIRDLWRAYGVLAGIINLGGNVLFVNSSPKKENGLWVLGVKDPKNDNKNITTVTIPECSAVTSGVYERYLEVNGHKYHHLIDPRTGYPLETDVAGVTTFTKNSVEAEIECKRLFFAGAPIDGWLEKDPDRLGAIFVYNDDKVEYVNF